MSDWIEKAVDEIVFELELYDGDDAMPPETPNETIDRIIRAHAPESTAELLQKIANLEVDLKAVTMQVDPRLIRIQMDSGDCHVVKFLSFVELDYSHYGILHVGEFFKQFIREVSALRKSSAPKEGSDDQT